MSSNGLAAQYSKTITKDLVGKSATIKTSIKCTYDDTGVMRWIQRTPTFKVASGLATNVIIKQGVYTTYNEGNGIYGYYRSVSATYMYSNMSFNTNSELFWWEFDEKNPSKGLYERKN